MKTKQYNSRADFKLNDNGSFVIENYNQSKPFSNFFPGIAGVWGIPMWVFYVNRGQCIASFGVEAKDKAIMEFQPANKSYRLTSLQGFRTFIKATSGSRTSYWEPFQNYLEGTHYQKKQTLSITAHDLTIEEQNKDLGLIITVNYFTLPEEPYAALVRNVTIRNTGSKSYDIEFIDGLPAIVPYGLKDGLIKNISRTVEAWVNVRNIRKKAPYYQLNVEVSDEPEVKYIEEGNFFFSFDPSAKNGALLTPIVESACIFGESCDFIAPVNFSRKEFTIPSKQETSNRTPSAFSYTRFKLKAKAKRNIVSLFGYAHSEAQLNRIVHHVVHKQYIPKKAELNKAIIEDIKHYALTNSSSAEFNLYSSQSFLDNILRGGLPVSLKTCEGDVALNVFSRKHGDLERDYNYFYLSPTFYSQGNGNYRDVNQNRRNDVWFNKDVTYSQLVNFLNLSQADGYNPLVVRGTSFFIEDENNFQKVLNDYVKPNDHTLLKKFVADGFMPGELFRIIEQKCLTLKTSPKVFLGKVLECCRRLELADHGEGFWSDHWTYNLDLIESYLAIYPEQLEKLLLEEKLFQFYHNNHYVQPRNKRYIETARGVRQYGSVANSVLNTGHLLRTNNGQGEIYTTHLLCKLLVLIANKAASLDPSGIGIEMEADKPNWYDALNGLPGLLGSSISETFEVKRFSRFVLDALNRIQVPDTREITLFEELCVFVSELNKILGAQTGPQDYWEESNVIKERYREQVRSGLAGNEGQVSVKVIKEFLQRVITKTDEGVAKAKNSKGFLPTYFYHDVVEYELLSGGSPSKRYVRPKSFHKHALPLFLEGYAHALRVAENENQARKLYDEVRNSHLFDKKLKMYKVNTDLSSETEEIGRARIFPSGWLENESIWLHMEYKFVLELLRKGLYEEFYANFKAIFIPFLEPERYGRSVLENSSFIVSSAHQDRNLHGQGFVARLSGSTAEFVHIWLLMNIGNKPFSVDRDGTLQFQLQPVLAGWLFTTVHSKVVRWDSKGNSTEAELPKNTYAFNLFGSTLVVYHNPKRLNTFGKNGAVIKEVHLLYHGKKKAIVIKGQIIAGDHATAIRERKLDRIDVYMK